jgi:hypothetical protein
MSPSSFDFAGKLLNCDLLASPHWGVHWVGNRSLFVFSSPWHSSQWPYALDVGVGWKSWGERSEAQHCVGTTWSWDHCLLCFTNPSCLPAVFDMHLTQHWLQFTPQASSLFPKQCEDPKPLRPPRAESLNIGQCNCPPMHWDLKARAHWG